MAHTRDVVFTGAVEGIVDDAILKRLGDYLGIQIGVIYGKNGKQDLWKRIGGYNRAAAFSPWIILIDLDQDAPCAPALLNMWVPDPSPNLYFRIAVRAAESWLLADRERISRFLGIAQSKIPHDPDGLPCPKKAIIDLLNSSKKRIIREDMLPRSGSGRLTGPAYASRLIEYITDLQAGWRPDIAAKNSESLARFLRAMKEF